MNLAEFIIFASPRRRSKMIGAVAPSGSASYQTTNGVRPSGIIRSFSRTSPGLPSPGSLELGEVSFEQVDPLDFAPQHQKQQLVAERIPEPGAVDQLPKHYFRAALRSSAKRPRTSAWRTVSSFPVSSWSSS